MATQVLLGARTLRSGAPGIATRHKDARYERGFRASDLHPSVAQRCFRHAFWTSRPVRCWHDFFKLSPTVGVRRISGVKRVWNVSRFYMCPFY